MDHQPAAPSYQSGTYRGVFRLTRQFDVKVVAGRRRTPEATLHFAELLGGWPTAYVAQRVLRHKISKRSYQLEFWTIVALYQAASLDLLNDGRVTRSVFLLLQHDAA